MLIRLKSIPKLEVNPGKLTIKLDGADVNENLFGKVEPTVVMIECSLLLVTSHTVFR